MVKDCGVQMVFRIVSSSIDLDLTTAQALDLYRQLRTALFTRPVKPVKQKAS